LTANLTDLPIPSRSDLPEERRAAIGLCATNQIVTPGITRGDETGPDRLKVCDLPLHLGQLGLTSSLQPALGAVVAMASGVKERDDLLQGEPEVLGSLKHPQRRHRRLGVETMPARTAVGLTENAAPPVVAQRLDVDPDSLGNLPGAEHAAHDPVPTRDVARAVKAASTS